MNPHYLYAAIDAGCLVVPLLASFHPAIRFYREWRYFLPAAIVVAALFIIWDIIFTVSGIWSFNPRYISGIYFFSLPAEEIAFFVCIPYACQFTYYCFQKFLSTPFSDIAATRIALALSAALAFVGLYHITHVYTSVTFLLLSVLLFVTARRGAELKYFFMAFVANLLPFFVSNGLLTGSWIAEPIVYYNNSFNLGLRVGTIPVEDFFYGMLFQWANVLGYNYLKTRKSMHPKNVQNVWVK